MQTRNIKDYLPCCRILRIASSQQVAPDRSRQVTLWTATRDLPLEQNFWRFFSCSETEFGDLHELTGDFLAPTSRVERSPRLHQALDMAHCASNIDDFRAQGSYSCLLQKAGLASILLFSRFLVLLALTLRWTFIVAMSLLQDCLTRLVVWCLRTNATI